MAFENFYFWSTEGLRLHYRCYAGPDHRPILLCLPGLTRNARDFEGLAGALAGDWTLWCPDLRGRGDSSYASDPLSYNPLTYVQDIEALLATAPAGRQFIFIGTSLGGIITMLMAGTQRERMAGAVLNDIGPVIEPAGLERIRGTVGRIGPWPTWMHLARQLQDQQADIYPDFALEDWLAFAKRLGCIQPSGRIVLDYDPRIAEPFRLPSGEAGVADLWPAFKALAGLPVLSLRGETSDILSAATQSAMAQRLPGLRTVTVPRTGHAPTLDEPESRAAIEALLAEVLQRAASIEPESAA